MTLGQTRSHPEMVGDMLHVTLNFDLSKISFVHFSQGQNVYSHQKLNLYIYWFSSESGYSHRPSPPPDWDASPTHRIILD